MDSYLHAQFAEIEWSHWWFLGRRAILRDVLARHVGPRAEILDVGCGAGALIPSLRELGTVTAMDTSAEALDYCQPLFPGVTFLKGIVPDDLPPGRQYGLVTAFDVIEHIDDDVAALASLRDVLAPGGRLVCTVPAYQWMWSPHDDLNDHKRRYTARLLRSRLEAAGFTVDKLSYFNTLLFPVVAFLRVFRRHVLRKTEPSSDFELPAPPVNRALAALMGSERFMLRKGSLPFGVSIVAVAH